MPWPRFTREETEPRRKCSFRETSGFRGVHLFITWWLCVWSFGREPGVVLSAECTRLLSGMLPKYTRVGGTG